MPAANPPATLLPAPRLSSDVGQFMADLAEDRMLAPARSANLELLLVGATVLPQRQEIARTPWGTWLFVDRSEDPTADRFGRVPVPAAEHARLVALDRAGVRPDRLWLAHQIPSSYRDGEPLPQLVPVPPHLREKDERLKQSLRYFTQVFLRGAGMLLGGAAAAPLALTVGAFAGAGLDPLVLGGVDHPSLPIVQWALLARWEWE